MNGYHIKTMSESNKEYLSIVANIGSQKQILEKVSALSSGLYYTTISNVESHSIMNKTTKSSLKHSDPKALKLWHNRSPKRTKMGPQCRLRIYICYDSPSIIRYLELMTGDVFIARFFDFQFDETIFPSLGEDKIVSEECIVPVEQPAPKERRELIWNTSTMSHLNSRTSQCENKVQRIVHLQEITNKLLDTFNNAAKVTVTCTSFECTCQH